VSQPLLLLCFIRFRRALQARPALTPYYMEEGGGQLLSESLSACFRHSILSSTALSSEHYFTRRGFVVCSTLIARCLSRSTFMADLSPIHFWPKLCAPEPGSCFSLSRVLIESFWVIPRFHVCSFARRLGPCTTFPVSYSYLRRVVRARIFYGPSRLPDPPHGWEGGLWLDPVAYEKKIFFLPCGETTDRPHALVPCGLVPPRVRSLIRAIAFNLRIFERDFLGALKLPLQGTKLIL
jgi:hypothetical protein